MGLDLTPIEEIKNIAEDMEKKIAEDDNNQKAIVLAQQTVEKKEEKETAGAVAVVEEQAKKDYVAISENEEFRRASLETHTREVSAELQSKANEIQDKELQNEYQAYLLKKKKEELDYRVRREKDIIKQDVKAQVFQKKYSIAKQRYGYLYNPTWQDKLDENGKPMKNENGEPIRELVPSKDFTSNSFLNKMREFEHYYENLSVTARKAIWTALKTVLIIGGIALGGFLLWKLVAFIANSGITI